MSSFLAHRRKAFRAFNGFGNASRDFVDTNLDYISIADDDALSFGDASTDSPFSVCLWAKMHDATDFRVLNKYLSNPNVEWNFGTIGSDKLGFWMYDASGSIYIGRLSTATFTADENTWVHICGTYDGSSSDAGLTLYRNGSAMADGASSAGSYVAMHNTTAPLQIGRVATFYSDGLVADVRLYNKELTAQEVTDISNGIHVSDSLVGWWLDDDDDVLDNAGTNDGTNNGSDYSTDGPNG